MKNGANIFLTPLFTVFWLLFSNIQVFSIPVLSNIETTNLEYLTGSGKVTLTKSIELRSDIRYIRSASIRIISGYLGTEDVLSLKNVNGITGSWDPKTGILTLSGLTSVNTYQTALKSVQYENTNLSNPSEANRTVSFTVTDIYGITSNTVSRNISIISPNVEPVIFNIETDAVIYCMNMDSVDISSTIDLRDDNDLNLVSADISIAAGYSPGEDLLVFKNRDGISGTWNQANGTLNLTGTASVENYRNALRSIKYRSLKPAEPSSFFHDITFSVNDGKVPGNTVSRNIVNHIPTASLSGNDSICPGDITSISIAFTGTSPWKFSYVYNSQSPLFVENVQNSPAMIPVSQTGSYTLQEMSDKFCPGNILGTADVYASPVPDVSLAGLASAYSKQSVEWVLLHGSPAGGQYSGTGVIPYGEDWYFIPALPSVGYHNVIYQYRVSPQSCYGYDTVTVRILESSAAIETENNRTKFCRNDAPFQVKGINLINQNYGSFSITGGLGLVDHGNNTATVYPSQLEMNHYNIIYKAFDGTSIQQEIEIGEKLTADFSWDTECFESGESISFNNKSESPFGFLNDNSYSWSLSGEMDSASAHSQDFQHSFVHPGNYQITLKLHNSYGCESEAVKSYSLNAVLALANEKYFESFNDQPGWHSESDQNFHASSWRLGSSENFTADHTGSKYWYTDITSSPSPREHSWIKSPCFDFRGTEKPTVAAQIQRSFINNRDGANFEYTVNDGASWIPVGNIYDGINWFNGYFGNPGEQAEGWTSGIDDDWVEIRHLLDFLAGEPKVQFRINYFAFGNASGNQGLAVNDFEISERNRTVLIEHFTNSSDAACGEADSLLNLVAASTGSNIIDLQYHSVDSQDPFYADNPVVAVARQFYYGISGVPYSIINGGILSRQRLDYNSLKPDENQMNIESLYNSDFNLSVVTMILDDTLYTETSVTALRDVPVSEISLRLAIIEPQITNITGKNGRTVFKNVVKDMLPDAAGNVTYQSWNRDETHSFRFVWPIRNVYNTADLRVVSFLQNENTREVYQAALDTRGIVNSPDVHADSKKALFTIYPNPVHEQIFVDLNEPVTGDIQFELFNNTGQLLIRQSLHHSTMHFQVPVSSLTPGIYLLKLTGDHESARQLVVVN